MIKRIVHIDRNYPRKFNGIDASGQTGVASNPNWSFDTESDGNLEGSVEKESNYSVTQQTSDDSNPDQLFNDRTATTTQYTNFNESDAETGKQIRFNANIFNYIVHTSIENIILKYDSPVVYAEGVKNKVTGEFAWKEKYLVLEGYAYHILFDILMHDPMGIDVYAYEAYVRNKPFGRQLRKEHSPSVDDLDLSGSETLITDSTSPVSFARFTSKTELESYKGRIPSSGAYITLHSNSGGTNHFKFAKLPDRYREEGADDTAFKISIQLGGMGYDGDYVNSTDSELEHWNAVIENKESTEQDIAEAWNACSGVKFKFFDVAGNITYWVMPYIEIVVISLEDLYNMKKLMLEFVDTRPADLQLGTDLIGRTTIKVTNPNHKLSYCDILINLDEQSLGELYKNTRKEQFIIYDEQHVGKIATEDVGNIDDSGWVIAHAEIDIADFVDELEFVRIMVRNLLRADGSLGEWIKECADNLRKINLDPFIPQYLKETTNKGSAYYKFAKFTENYLNTMFKAYDKNCYISVLEAIARIGNFNDYTTIYKNLLDKYDDDHGDMLHITSDELRLLIDTEKQDVKNET